jgi:hypothetical protein
VSTNLANRLAAVYTAWLAHGPSTTRRLAEASGIDILNVRPRTTDLVHMGLVRLCGSAGGEGIYAACTRDEWEQWAADLRGQVNGQLSLAMV